MIGKRLRVVLIKKIIGNPQIGHSINLGNLGAYILSSGDITE